MILDFLEFRQANPVEFGELVASRGLNVEEETKRVRVINIKNIFVMILLMWQLSKQGCYC